MEYPNIENLKLNNGNTLANVYMHLLADYRQQRHHISALQKKVEQQQQTIDHLRQRKQAVKNAIITLTSSHFYTNVVTIAMKTLTGERRAS